METKWLETRPSRARFEMTPYMRLMQMGKTKSHAALVYNRFDYVQYLLRKVRRYER